MGADAVEYQNGPKKCHKCIKKTNMTNINLLKPYERFIWQSDINLVWQIYQLCGKEQLLHSAINISFCTTEERVSGE